MSYTYPLLPGLDLGLIRIFGSGLANLLFPWGRSIVAARRLGLRPIWPTWPQVKVGPVIRGEGDKRFYCSLFRPTDNYVYGAEKLWRLASLKRYDESALGADLPKNSVATFSGHAGHFETILMDHDLVRRELLAIVRGEHKAALQSDCHHSLSVHVRLGDFAAPNTPYDLNTGKTCLRIPINWYVSAVRTVRRGLSDDLPVHVFSDGSDRELAPLLALPACRRVTFGSAIADLLALSYAGVLIASGSTFSMWASYLGRMPVIWHKGQLLQQLYYESPVSEIDLALAEEPSADFLGAAERSVKGL